ncbi:MAG: phage holin family protein [Burkholderiales bacterium]|nr:phage holin family protein [Burkholderiales bacterium]
MTAPPAVSTTGSPRGLFASGQRLLGTALELLQVRADLLALEFENEKQRLLDALGLAVMALLGLGIGVLLLCAWLVMAVDPAQRERVLAALALLFLAGGAWALQAARARLRHPEGLFKLSAAELARDREALAAAAGRVDRSGRADQADRADRTGRSPPD